MLAQKLRYAVQAPMPDPISGHESTEEILDGYDVHAIEEVLVKALREEAEGFYSDPEAAVAVKASRESVSVLNLQDGADQITKQFDAFAPGQKKVFTRINFTKGLAMQAAVHIAEGNVPDDRAHNPLHYETIMTSLHEAGCSAEKIEEMADHTTQANIATAHPTGYLSDEGTDLFLQLQDLSQVPKGERLSAARGIFRKMFSLEHLAPNVKFTSVDETKMVFKYGIRAMRGRWEVNGKFDQISAKVYGADHYLPTMINSKVRLDHTPRAWQTSDIDGRANAERWTSLYGLVTSMYGSISVLTRLVEETDKVLGDQTAKPELSDLDNLLDQIGQPRHKRQVRPELKGSYDLLWEIREELAEIHVGVERGLQEISTTGLEAKQRQEEFESRLKEFDVLRERFGSIFNNRRFNNRKLKQNGGYSFQEELIDNLNYLRNNNFHGNDTARDLLGRALLNLHHDGLSIFKSQMRTNYEVDKAIVDNLMWHEPFRKFAVEHKIVAQEDFGFIDASEGGSIHNLGYETRFRILSSIKQGFANLEHQGYKNRLHNFLLESNPLGFNNGLGYPDQNHERLQHCEHMSMYPFMYDQRAIIADANDVDGDGPSLCQDLIFSAFPHMEGFIHMPLPETLDSLRASADRVRTHYMHGGRNKINWRLNAPTIPDEFKTSGIAAKISGSDNTKEGGPGTRELIYRQVIKMFRAGMGLANAIPVNVQSGSGDAIARNGGDEDIILGLLFQVVQETQDAQASITDPQKKLVIDWDEFKTGIKYLMVTRQGQAMYRTPSSMAREEMDRKAQLLGMLAELEGVFKRGSFIPQREEFSPNLEIFLKYAANKMVRRYYEMREATTDTKSGEAVLDKLGLILSNPLMADMANNASRPPAKNHDGKIKSLRQQRAIGSNIWIALMMTHHDGWYTVGHFMEDIHKAYHKELQDLDDEGNPIQLEKKDLEQLMSSSRIDYNFFARSLTEAARADFEHRLRRLNLDQPLNFDRAVAIGSRSYAKDGVFHYPHQEGIGQTQAYFAHLFYDHTKARATAEALLSNRMDDTFKDIIQSAKPADGSLRTEFNGESMKRWPWLENIQRQKWEARPALLVCDYYEEQKKKGASMDEDTLREASAAWRVFNVPHRFPFGTRRLQGTLSLGRRTELLPENPRDILASFFPSEPSVEKRLHLVPSLDEPV
ncbi:MAG TPA: hypothetical protein DEA55_04900 [Rhodospirillaceae bacterium]|nr:hypothetical protein [Rhodospirillaceae bacterium]